MAELNLSKSYYFDTFSCYTCGCVVALEAQFVRNRQKDKQEWFCPNGHNQYFAGETEEQRLKKQLEDERRESTRLRTRLEEEKRSHSATKGKATKAAKRTAAGVCPCCNRSFGNLARHMKCKHPEHGK